MSRLFNPRKVVRVMNVTEPEWLAIWEHLAYDAEMTADNQTVVYLSGDLGDALSAVAIARTTIALSGDTTYSEGLDEVWAKLLMKARGHARQQVQEIAKHKKWSRT